REGLVLADEVLTPDSSRFWPKESYQAGRSQPSLDKQYVRDYLESIGWDKNPPAPPLPEEIVEGTCRRDIDIFQRLTGRTLGQSLPSRERDAGGRIEPGSAARGQWCQGTARPLERLL